MSVDYVAQIKTNNILNRLRVAQEAMRDASEALRLSSSKNTKARGKEMNSAANMIDGWIENIKNEDEYSDNYENQAQGL